MEIWCQAKRAEKSSREGNLIITAQVLCLPEVAQGRKNPLWMGLPTRLRKLRSIAALTTRQLSQHAGCAKNLPLNVENGLQTPGIDIVEKLAFALGISPVFLAFGPEGAEPFRPKTPSYLKSDETPKPQPGTGVFRERYKGAAERLRTSRERLGLSLRDLAAAAQVSYQAVLYTETGKTVPRLDTVEAIAVALDVAPGWLAYGDDE